MIVFVINKHGEVLMPCKPSKARKLIKKNKAKVVNYKPFTIQLIYGSGGYKQPIALGVDLGSKNIGIAITSNDKVLVKGEIELRCDVKTLLTTRSIYRRSRRARKTRYRETRFLNRTSSKKEGWLPPSTLSRINNTFNWIDKFAVRLPNPKISIEVGKFNTAKMINPDIEGKTYQQGETYGFYSDRYYVFARDNYTCQICKKKGGILQTHHIIQRSQGGSDRVGNLITVHLHCHQDYHVGKVKHNFAKPKTYKAPIFMNIIKKFIYKKYPNANITYGYITVVDRKALWLEKTHYNDAIAISGIKLIKNNCDNVFKIKQFRKKKRSLHEATARKGRTISNVNQQRNSKNTKKQNGFYLNDKVKIFDKIGFISGFTGSGCYIKDIENNYITTLGKDYKQVNLSQLKLINHNNNWQMVTNAKVI